MGTKRVNCLSTNAAVAGYKSTDYKTSAGIKQPTSISSYLAEMINLTA